MTAARAAALVALTIAAGGCGETAKQTAARHAVERVTAGDVHCTNGAPGFFGGGPPVTVFVCAAKTGGGRCDRYEARLRGKRWAVALRSRRGDCTLPAT